MSKLLKENIFELLLLIGLVLFSIGFFMFSVQIGFIVTGLIIIVLTIYLNKEQQGGGD
ncbi:hypothetical protein [Solibacillus sp. FSL K6-1523]|uniref:hypothetical protein n=1 Tax=Solibacillus sp. FSL K6-1523 TaxID=2921471 RepID=UPI0030F9B04D